VTHFKRMELEKIGVARLEHEKLRQLLGEMKPGTYQAINDISIVNELGVGARSLSWLQLGARDPMPAGRRTEYVTLSDLSAVVDELEPI
jgi:hypothetical protein